jgi:chorismate dehydratase
MNPVRIACVRYLNTVPLIEGLGKVAGVELVPVVPSRIADLVASNEADIGLVSLIDAARSDVPLALLPVGMIGCDGPTLTVRLFSSVPLDRIESIHSDTDSHTSSVLARVLLHRLHGIRPPVIDFDARERVASSPGGPTPTLDEAWPATLLLIGDKVVTDSPPAVRYPHQLDLGQAWRELTGLPFVYAMWMCRADRMEEETITLAARLLDRQRRHNRTRLDWIVSRRAPEHHWPHDLASRYLGTCLRYDVGSREREAAERFIAEAAALGLVERRALLWADGALAGAAV